MTKVYIFPIIDLTEFIVIYFWLIFNEFIFQLLIFYQIIFLFFLNKVAFLK